MHGFRGEEQRFDLRLPEDLRRAGPDIYRRIRSQGACSVRDWLTTEHGDSRSDHRWSDLWQAAVSVDFALGPCSTRAEAMQKLSTDDNMEMLLRRIGSFVYKVRGTRSER